MYLDHFGLEEPPFSLTPDPDFFYNFTGHQQALNVLRVALDNGEGFIKITGEVGTGKTLLCRKLLASLAGDSCTAYLPNPLLSPFELHKALAEELGLETVAGATTHDLVKQITGYLVQLQNEGQRAVLCIDEAQAMPRESLEALRLLSNLETEKHKLLQIVVFAQPELNVLLERSDLRQLRQRITFSYELPPLDRQGMEGYVGHRLQTAGMASGALFSQNALDLLYRSSRGIPRLVNVLSHKALMAAYGQGLAQIDSGHVRAACADTEDVVAASLPRVQQPFYWAMGAATLVELVIVVYLLQRIVS